MASVLIKYGQVSMHASARTVGNYGMHNYMKQIDVLFLSLCTETRDNIQCSSEHVYKDIHSLYQDIHLLYQDIHSQMQIHF